MKKKKRLISVLSVVILLICIVSFLNPKIRINLFVVLHSGQIEYAYQSGVYPETFGGKHYTVQNGKHPVIEFSMVGKFGAPYCGCYYSPDDVPRSFQNAYPLVQANADAWTWSDAGGNHGLTEKIKDCWYYYEARF